MASLFLKLRGLLKRSQRTFGARALVIRDDQVLLVRHTYTDKWYTIGGGVEKGESPLEAVTRELREEAGITPTAPLRLMGVYHSTLEKRDDYIALYICDRFNKAAVKSLEIAEEKWFPLNALPENVSPATERRIGEFLGKRKISDKW